eukprot:gb/GECG01010713.1/.p1 GENE.gb/GECG01010713.1/~~gb/GECG01010713.1/.p1  ORF type:complete len:187 (+),score=27.13 gb/GECG01010713.1/:1-561(+)
MITKQSLVLLRSVRMPSGIPRWKHGSVQRASFQTKATLSRQEPDSGNSVEPREKDSTMASNTPGDGSGVGKRIGEGSNVETGTTGEDSKGLAYRVAPKTSVHRHNFSAWKFILGMVVVAYTWKYFMYNRAMQTLLDAEQRHNEEMEDMSNAERIASKPEAFLDWQRIRRRVEEEEELHRKHSNRDM